MIDIEKLKEKGKECGFTVVETLNCHTIEVRPEVRDMCKSGSCHVYGKRWSCPPACGTLDECKEEISRYSKGILVQTVGKIEDSMDGEGMMRAEAEHKDHFLEFEKYLRKKWPNMLSLSAGSCTKCKECTYPDEPCRFPGAAFSSMEAYGLLVTQVCQANKVKYYYGPCTIAYTSCYLLE